MKMFEDPNYPLDSIIEDITNLASLVDDPIYGERAKAMYISILLQLATMDTRPEIATWAKNTLERYKTPHTY